MPVYDRLLADIDRIDGGLLKIYNQSGWLGRNVQPKFFIVNNHRCLILFFDDGRVVICLSLGLGMRGRAVLPVLMLALSGCGAASGPVPHGEVCRAVVSAYMARPLAEVQLWEVGDEVAAVQYRRDDGTLWRWRCHIVWPAVTLAAYQPDGSLGRWRDRSADDKVSVAAVKDGLSVTVRFADGSESVRQVAFPVGK